MPNTLLWIDDEIDLLKSHILFLNKKGYAVDTATNGYDALEMCQTANYDLVLLDENMPGLSGLETLDRIKEISPATPVVIGEYQNEAIKTIFERRANELHAPIRFAQNIDIETPACPLQGIYQTKNKRTVAVAVAELQQRGIAIAESDIRNGFAQVLERTHLQGRWQKIGENPLVICDTGHNEGGFRYLAAQLGAQPCATLRIVIGMVGDKDIDAVLQLLPRKAVYYFTKASIPRALNEYDLQQKAQKYGLCGRCFATVNEALTCAKNDAVTNDFIFVGGSNFVVAEVL